MKIIKLQIANDLMSTIERLHVDIDSWKNRKYKHSVDHSTYIEDDIYKAFRLSVINDLRLKLIDAQTQLEEL